MWRRLPPVLSPLPFAAVAAAFAPGDPRETLTAALRSRFGAGAAALVDSGTSALALALRAAAAEGEGRPCALPAYGCFDLITAAQAADVRVVLYDLDPLTLLPDDASLEHALAQGLSSLVVVHQYGLPAPVAALRARANAAGALLIEDAAQGAGGAVDGVALGAGGDLGVLSFGRGKGLTGGGGGALLALEPERLRRAITAVAGSSASGNPVFGVKLAAQWLLGRPSLYAIPSSIPALRLGETVYRAPHAASRMSAAAARVLSRTLPLLTEAVAGRARRSESIIARAGAIGGRIIGVSDRAASPAWLRLPVLGRRSEAALRQGRRLGCVPGYPIRLDQLDAARSVLLGSAALPGAQELAERLWTAPLHDKVGDADEGAIAQWIGSLEA